MGLAGIVRKGVAIAHKITNKPGDPLQALVTHEAWIGADKYGKPQFETGIERPALVEKRAQSLGSQILITTTVTFLHPVEANGSEDRQEPIDPRDKITLADGWSGPIVSINGLVDPLSGNPYLYEVSLGDGGGR